MKFFYKRKGVLKRYKSSIIIQKFPQLKSVQFEIVQNQNELLRLSEKKYRKAKRIVKLKTKKIPQEVNILW